MKTDLLIQKRISLLVASCVLFVTSFFLPAYYDAYGYFCAYFCLTESLDHWNLYEVIYYFSFTFSNIVMIVLPILLFTKWKRMKIKLYVIIIQFILVVHVVSWIFMQINLEYGIQIGYYVWLGSMLMLLAITIAQRRFVDNALKLQDI